MLFTGWGGVIRVFPGVPSSWPDVTVHDVAVEGAFLLSAVRRGGTTQFVRIKSLAGEPCRVAPGLPARTTCAASRSACLLPRGATSATALSNSTSKQATTS